MHIIFKWIDNLWLKPRVYLLSQVLFDMLQIYFLKLVKTLTCYRQSSCGSEEWERSINNNLENQTPGSSLGQNSNLGYPNFRTSWTETIWASEFENWIFPSSWSLMIPGIYNILHDIITLTSSGPQDIKGLWDSFYVFCTSGGVDHFTNGERNI